MTESTRTSQTRWLMVVFCVPTASSPGIRDFGVRPRRLHERLWRGCRRNRRVSRKPRIDATRSAIPRIRHRQEAAFLEGPERRRRGEPEPEGVREQSRSFADAGRRKSPEAVPRQRAGPETRPNGSPLCWSRSPEERRNPNHSRNAHVVLEVNDGVPRANVWVETGTYAGILSLDH